MAIATTGILINGPSGENTLKLGDHLGGGAFGVVFKAEDQTNGEIYAVKFPQASVFGGATELTAFLNEAATAGKISHPNVVNILHIETDKAPFAPYMVMEYISGGTLQAKINYFENNRTFFDLDILKRWSLELAEGMKAINAVLLHRDIKPDNILVENDHLKISDFGISKIVDALTRNAGHTFKGGQAVHYMAPEAWRFEKNTIQLDMYSIGIVLFQIASLQYPYNLPNTPIVSALKDMHTLQNPKPLRDIRDDLPNLFYQIVSRLMAKRPEERFSTWDEVIDSLNNAWLHVGTTPLTTKGLLMSLVDNFGKRYDETNKRKLEQEQKREEIEEQEKLDKYQWGILLKDIEEIVQRFNQQSPVVKIESNLIPGIGILTIKLPLDAGTFTLSPFKVEPPINLSRKGWTIRFATILKTGDGLGFNIVLCRTSNEDLYGKWIVLKVGMNAISRHRRTAPFGFMGNEDMQGNLKLSTESMHTFVVNFSDDLEANFLELIQQILNS